MQSLMMLLTHNLRTGPDLPYHSIYWVNPFYLFKGAVPIGVISTPPVCQGASL